MRKSKQIEELWCEVNKLKMERGHIHCPDCRSGILEWLNGRSNCYDGNGFRVHKCRSCEMFFKEKDNKFTII